MRILLAHNRYQWAGGEDSVVDQERDLLIQSGNTVHLWEVSNSDISGPLSSLKAAWNAPYSRPAYEEMKAVVRDFKPEVVHVHNFFPLLTPSIYDACKESGIPVVQSLHNYRLTCANGLFLREGQACELCITGTPYQGALHACYRDSRLASLAVSRMIAFHRGRDTWNKKVRRFIVPSRFAYEKFKQAGIQAHRMEIKPHCLQDPLAEGSSRAPSDFSAVYVGRLSEEKGIQTLIQAWKQMPYKLTLIGDGPLLSEIHSQNPENILATGRLSDSTLWNEMRKANVLIAPSECYETFGMAIIEAYSLGLPVIASDCGALAELVHPGKTGVLFKSGNASDLSEKVRQLATQPAQLEAMAKHARESYLQDYTPKRNLEQLLEIYRSVLTQA